MTLELLLDLLLATALVGLGWRALWSDDLFTSIVLFIAFGLLMSVVWVRLSAPDIALAEAAVGAGITGALLLDASRDLRPTARDAPPSRGGIAGVVTLAALVALFFVLAAAMLELAERRAGLAVIVSAAMPDAASTHPVTAVLLEFRGYDTWLETGVLLLAALGVLAVRGTQHPVDADSGARALSATADPMVRALLRALVPLLVLCAGYLLWLGTHAPGGAFQSGALLGSAGILLAVSGTRSVTALGVVGLRGALLAALIAFTVIAIGGVALGGQMLALDDATAKVVLVLVETAVALSVGVTLTVLFVAGRPVGQAGMEQRVVDVHRERAT